MKKNLILLIFIIYTSYAFTQTASFLHNGVLRDYIYYVPPSYNGSEPVPLILNLHGYTSNASQQQLYTQFDLIADTAKFIVIYPNGLGNSWNSGWNYPYYSGTDDVGFLSALIDTIQAHYNIDPYRIFATGMSNGGFMSFRLACELSHRIAAIASVTGLMSVGQTQNCNPIRKVPVMFIHGTSDATVAFNGSTYHISADSTQNYWRAKNNCSGPIVLFNFPNINTSDLSTAERYLSNTCGDSSEVEFIKIINGGHTWPGVYSLPNLVTNQDIKASAEIWNFFKRHPLPGAPLVISETPKKSLSVYPNPAQNIVNINATNFFNYMLFDILGNLIVKQNYNSPSTEINISLLPDGVYILHIETHGEIFINKIIKVK